MNPEESDDLQSELDYRESRPSLATHEEREQFFQQVSENEKEYQREVIRQTKQQLLHVCWISVGNQVPQSMKDGVAFQNDIEMLQLAMLHALRASTPDDLEVLARFLKGEANNPCATL